VKIANRVGCGLVIGAGIVLLAGCSTGGSQPAFAPGVSGPRAVGAGADFGPNRGRAWMSPDAKKKDLLYISDAEANLVDVYSYPSDKLKGQLSGFAGVQGLCTDKKGNIWIANMSQGTMLEYKHGGTQPIATLDDSGYDPEACAVNVKTGDLAVANTNGGLAIYKGAKGTAQLYSDPNLTFGAYIGYDNAGNVFVDGQGTTNFVLAELPNGGSTMETIATSLDSGGLPDGIQWDGKYLTVGLSSSTQAIYQLTVSGSSATTVGTTTLSGPRGIGQYLVLTKGKTQGKSVIVPELGSGGVVGYFKYPAGGTATKSITGLENPLTVALSKGK
jgi:hypothetical protein